MAKLTFKTDDEGLHPIKVTQLITIGISRFVPGRNYRVDADVLNSLGDKAQPADE